MPPQFDHLAWTRSIVVAGAMVLAALIPVLAKDDKPERTSIAPVVKTRPVERALTGNRHTCLALRGLPVAVLEQRYAAVKRDQNESGDTSIPMRGGQCWIKWHYPDPKSARGGYAERVKFYEKEV